MVERFSSYVFGVDGILLRALKAKAIRYTSWPILTFKFSYGSSGRRNFEGVSFNCESESLFPFLRTKSGWRTTSPPNSLFPKIVQRSFEKAFGVEKKNLESGGKGCKLCPGGI